MTPKLPRVYGVLRQDAGEQYWEVAGCPYCAQTHRHSAGEDPRDFLGEVAAPCGKGRYILQEKRTLSAAAGGDSPGVDDTGGDGNEPNILIDEPG